VRGRYLQPPQVTETGAPDNSELFHCALLPTRL
jgi:hypothetical protein